MFLGEIVSHHRLPDITNVSEDFLPMFVAHWDTFFEVGFDVLDGVRDSLLTDILAF